MHQTNPAQKWITVLFLTAPDWESSVCLSLGKWVKITPVYPVNANEVQWPTFRDSCPTGGPVKIGDVKERL